MGSACQYDMQRESSLDGGRPEILRQVIVGSRLPFPYDNRHEPVLGSRHRLRKHFGLIEDNFISRSVSGIRITISLPERDKIPIFLGNIG
jgi:hypothetical protein